MKITAKMIQRADIIPPARVLELPPLMGSMIFLVGRRGGRRVGPLAFLRREGLSPAGGHVLVLNPMHQILHTPGKTVVFALGIFRNGIVRHRLIDNLVDGTFQLKPLLARRSDVIAPVLSELLQLGRGIVRLLFGVDIVGILAQIRKDIIPGFLQIIQRHGELLLGSGQLSFERSN